MKLLKQNYQPSYYKNLQYLKQCQMLTLWLLGLSFINLMACKPNPAPYIKQQGRPLNIAYRGLSSILPENTIEAFEAALYQGADFIQLDVVYTKQKYPLVMHDPYLTRITNIRDKYEYSTRYQTRHYNGANKTDWWTDSFTLAELQRLGIKQDEAPGRINKFDWRFTFSTLDQVIQMVIKFNLQHKGKRNPDGRLAGILIEAKDSQMYRDLYGVEIGQAILRTLAKYNISKIEQAVIACPIYLQSFDFQTVKYWSQHSELPINYLLMNTMPYHLEDVAKYATGVGYQDKMVWDYFLSEPTFLLEQTRKYGLLIHVWTFKDDAMIFQAITNIDMYQIGQVQMQLDGIITEFSNVYAPISQLLKKVQDSQSKEQFDQRLIKKKH